MAETRVSYDTIIDGDPEAVFWLVSDIDRWPALFPHVRSVKPLGGDGVEVALSWRMLPFRLRCSQTTFPETSQVEQRFQGRAGLQVVCRWTVRATPDGRTHLMVEARSALGPGLVLRTVTNDLIEQTLAMIRLLAESDRKARP